MYVYTYICIYKHMIGEMSQLAKRDGYIVAMAPMESYMDPTTSIFGIYIYCNVIICIDMYRCIDHVCNCMC
jgi:hypothetical protein